MNIASETGAHDATPPLLRDLSEHSFLKGLSAKHLEVLAGCAMAAQFESGQIIFREGEPANRFYLLKSGKVVLESSHESGTVSIQTVGEGDVLGWSWLFPPYYWHFDARALERSQAIFFYGTRLREICEKDHDLGYELMKRTANIVISRLMATRQKLAGPTAA